MRDDGCCNGQLQSTFHVVSGLLTVEEDQKLLREPFL